MQESSSLPDACIFLFFSTRLSYRYAIGQGSFANPDQIAGGEDVGLDALVVDIGAVGGTQVLQDVIVFLSFEDGVVARNFAVVDDDMVVGGTPDV